MSGGSLDYAFRHIDEAIDQILNRHPTVVQRAFATHLKLVSLALHDLEWALSGDTSPGNEVPAIMAVIKPQDVVLEAVATLRAAMLDAEELLARS